MKKTKLAILVVMALLAAGCGKIRTCYCMNNSYFDIIDTALHDSVPYPIYENSFLYERESAVECSYWSYQDTVGHYMPEYGIRTYAVLDCHEK